jgi:hypothetical protein
MIRIFRTDVYWNAAEGRSRIGRHLHWKLSLKWFFKRDTHELRKPAAPICTRYPLQVKLSTSFEHCGSDPRTP